MRVVSTSGQGSSPLCGVPVARGAGIPGEADGHRHHLGDLGCDPRERIAGARLARKVEGGPVDDAVLVGLDVQRDGVRPGELQLDVVVEKAGIPALGIGFGCGVNLPEGCLHPDDERLVDVHDRRRLGGRQIDVAWDGRPLCKTEDRYTVDGASAGHGHERGGRLIDGVEGGAGGLRQREGRSPGERLGGLRARRSRFTENIQHRTRRG